MRALHSLYSFRFAMLSSLGLIQACGASSELDTARSQGRRSEEDASAPRPGRPEPTDASVPAPRPTTPIVPPATSVTGAPVPVTPPTATPTVTGTSVPAPTVTQPSPPATSTVTPVPTTPSTNMPQVPSVCEAPETAFGPGLSSCANGIVHRAQPETCEVIYPRPGVVVPVSGGSAQEGPGAAAPAPLPLPPQDPAPAVDAGAVPPYVDAALPPSDDLTVCTQDTDCTAADYGHCEYYTNETQGITSYCQYDSCATDAECGEFSVCECGEGAGRCVNATCRSDADCTDGNVCARFEYESGCGLEQRYACTHPNDTCRVQADCMTDDYSGCQPSWDTANPGATCDGPTCVEGRPFLVSGVARTAAVENRQDWLTSVHPNVLKLSQAEQQTLAGEWQRIALMEHASIAAFARFALQLLAVGAPPQLLAATQAAMVDETLHAQLAFGLASSYGGRALGPGALSCEGALQGNDLTNITLNTVLEGCIGETLAALDAKHALTHCKDEAVRKVLEVIARDEARHAELAWKFVQWALAQDVHLAKQVSALVAAELRDAELEFASHSAVAPEPDWMLAHGILPERQRAELRLAALKDVVMPCMRALCLASAPSTAARNPQVEATA